MGRKNAKEFLSGALFVALGMFFLWQSQGLQTGSARSMGPGYFPQILSILVAILGLIIAINGLLCKISAETSVNIAWRAFAILTLSLVLFGILLRPLGFVPTLVLIVFLSAMASRKFRLHSAVLLSAGVTAFCWAIFVAGLRLPLPLVGDLIGGR